MAQLEKNLATNSASIVTQYLGYVIARSASTGLYSVWAESGNCIETGLQALWQAQSAIERR